MFCDLCTAISQILRSLRRFSKERLPNFLVLSCLLGGCSLAVSIFSEIQFAAIRSHSRLFAASFFCVFLRASVSPWLILVAALLRCVLRG